MWRNLHVPPTFSPRSGHFASLLEDSIVVAGGCNGSRFFNDVWVLNCASESLTLLESSAPFQPCAYASCTALNPSSLWFIGGANSSTVFSDTHCLDLPTGKWSPRRQLGRDADFPISTHSAVQHPYLPRTVLLFGGYGGLHTKYLGDLSLFHTDNCRWETLNPRGVPPSARGYHSMIKVQGGASLLVYGGRGPHGVLGQSDNLRIYDPRNNAWLDPLPSEGPTPLPRTNQAVTAVGGRGALVHGGRRGGDRLADAHLLEVPTEASASASLRWSPVLEFSEAASCPVGSRSGHSVMTWRNSVVVIGGYRGNKVSLGDILIRRDCSSLLSETSTAEAEEAEDGGLPPKTPAKRKWTAQIASLPRSAAQSNGWISTAKNCPVKPPQLHKKVAKTAKPTSKPSAFGSPKPGKKTPLISPLKTVPEGLRKVPEGELKGEGKGEDSERLCVAELAERVAFLEASLSREGGEGQPQVENQEKKTEKELEAEASEALALVEASRKEAELHRAKVRMLEEDLGKMRDRERIRDCQLAELRKEGEEREREVQQLQERIEAGRAEAGAREEEAVKLGGKTSFLEAELAELRRDSGEKQRKVLELLGRKEEEFKALLRAEAEGRAAVEERRGREKGKREEAEKLLEEERKKRDREVKEGAEKELLFEMDLRQVAQSLELAESAKAELEASLRSAEARIGELAEQNRVLASNLASARAAAEAQSREAKEVKKAFEQLEGEAAGLRKDSLALREAKRNAESVRGEVLSVRGQLDRALELLSDGSHGGSPVRRTT